MEVDYIIIGAGSAGCVMANRLSKNPQHQVLLIEAGPSDKSPYIHMPKGLGKLMQDPKHAWFLKVEPHAGNGFREEVWSRGKMLGGCSSINGMTYVRGQPQDYDDWEAAGNPGWGWSTFFSAYRAIEDHALGDDGVRGVGGPVHVERHPSNNVLNRALMEAGRSLGVPVREDVNGLDQAGIGPMMSNVKDGRRVSAAVAFLRPAMNRPNLRVITDTLVHRIHFEGHRAAEVSCGPLAPAGIAPTTRHRARREIVVCAGAIHSPLLLQRSGVGPAEVLQASGVDVVRDAPGVGGHLLEHWMGFQQYRLRQPLSVNHDFSGLKLVGNVLRYLLGRRGPMATGTHEVNGFIATQPGNPRPDAQIIAAPFSWATGDEMNKFAFEREHGVQMMGYPLRATSQGTVTIRSASVHDEPCIQPNYLTSAYDREVTVRIFRFMRRLFAQPALAPFVSGESFPGAAVSSDDEILDHYRKAGMTGYHSSGTCRMGPGDDAVVDHRLRVKGVDGLRVVDTSVFPTMMSGNTNAAAMALAWRAGELMVQDSGPRVQTIDAASAP